MKTSSTKAGIFNPDFVLAFSLCSVGAMLGMASLTLGSRNAIAQTTGHSPPDTTYWTAGSACPQYGITFGTDSTLYFDGSGQFSTSLQTDSRYRLTLTWNASPPTGMQYADLKVTWPAPIDPGTPTPSPSGSAEMFAAFDWH